MAAYEFIKKPHLEQEFSIEQINELKKCINDPIHFIVNHAVVQHPVKGKIPFKLFDFQEEMLQLVNNNRFSVLLLGRQLGKSISIAIYLLWYTMFNFDKIVLVAAHKNSHAMEIMDRIRYCYEELPNWLKPGVVYYNKHEIEFDNGSKIISSATTENTARGMSLSKIYLDEFAFINPRIQQAFWTSILPTLSTGGEIIITSTPNGDTDLFAQVWRGAEAGLNGFASFVAKWDAHPERTSDFKNQMIAQLGIEKFKQEHECEFISSDYLLINSIVLSQIKSEPHLFEDRGFKFWGEINPSKMYYIGVDIATGVGEDFSTIQVFEMPTMEQTAEFRSNKVTPQQLYSAVKWIINYILKEGQKQNKTVDIYWSYENNGVGISITTLYQNDENFPMATLISENNNGLVTTGKNKMESCLELKKLIEKKNGLKIKSEKLLFELKNYVVHGAAYAAKPGATDDLISAVLIIMQIMKRAALYEEELFEKMYDFNEEFYDDSGYEEPPAIVM